MNESEKSENLLLTTCYLFNKKTDHVTGFSSKVYEINRISNTVFLGVLTVSTILLNAVAIMTIQKTPKLKDKPSHFLILIQSVIDLTVGCIVIPAIIVFLLDPFINSEVCITFLFAKSSTYFFTGISIHTLSALTLERYLGVLHPIFHRTRLTKKRIVTCIVGGALVPLLLTTALIFTQGRIIIKYISIVILATFLIFLVFAYTRIYLVIRKITRVSTNDEAGDEIRKHSLREKKHSLTCFIIVALFVFFLIPYMLHPIFQQFGRMTFNLYMWWSVSLLLSISSLNSVIFFWKNTVFRKAAKNVVKNMFE